MPTEYIREGKVNRGQWSEGNLREALGGYKKMKYHSGKQNAIVTSQKEP
jgi:hypothetical protein